MKTFHPVLQHQLPVIRERKESLISEEIASGGAWGRPTKINLRQNREEPRHGERRTIPLRSPGKYLLDRRCTANIQGLYFLVNVFFRVVWIRGLSKVLQVCFPPGDVTQLNECGLISCQPFLKSSVFNFAILLLFYLLVL